MQHFGFTTGQFRTFSGRGEGEEGAGKLVLRPFLVGAIPFLPCQKLNLKHNRHMK